jgi:hypothetical protein
MMVSTHASFNICGSFENKAAPLAMSFTNNKSELVVSGAASTMGLMNLYRGIMLKEVSVMMWIALRSSSYQHFETV